MSTAVDTQRTGAAARLQVRIARTEAEFAQIARLNYETFVEEIPQHARNANRALTDRFHHENTYFICTEGEELVGMVALRDRRPFSLDEKLPDLNAHLPPCEKPCEIRLLSVRPDRRHTGVFGLLMQALLAHCLKAGHDLGVISGRVENIPLYEKLGFKSFGPVVGREGAWYQPMHLSRETIDPSLSIHPSRSRDRDDADSGRTINFLPGPVAIADPVREALASAPLSHRSEAYHDMLRRAKARLIEMTGAGGVEILTGTGTLANDAVAAQLSLLECKGLVIANGEFGERLVRHAQGARLDHIVYRSCGEGSPDLAEVGRLLDEEPDIGWIWAVHCETSTGRINPVAALRDLCRERNLRLCLDCISALGVIPVDLRGVHLASGVSGKGIGAYTGLCMVFSDRRPAPSNGRLPRAIDLGRYAATNGVPYSASSNLLAALLRALDLVNRDAFIEALENQSAWFESELNRAGIPVLGRRTERSPAVITILLPTNRSSKRVGRSLERRGILISYASGYLENANRIQVCLMTVHERGELSRLVAALSHAIRRP